MGQNLDFDGDNPSLGHSEPFRRRQAEVDNPSSDIGPPVVDSHHRHPSVFEIGYQNFGSEGQAPVSCGHVASLVDFSAGGFSTDPLARVIRGLPLKNFA